MKKLLLVSLILFLFNTADAQWYFGTRMADMPEPISNNAVVEGWANDTAYVYSFGGIDTTKIWSGISLKSFRYNTVTDVWDTIPDLPNTLENIAMGASWVDSIVYIMGGYHVLSNGNEISSNIVNRYDPRTNTYLSDGANIPVPIDDHVQAVWNDSLIYVITGWSNSGNVPDVQIYDPANDNWLTGTPVPNSNSYKAFGASGAIAGNTIIYHGGASTGFNFPAQAGLRIGQINPTDPTQITWSVSTPNSAFKTYRAACSFEMFGPSVNWLGGSDVSYNYNGIAYNGSGGVQPKNRNLWSPVGANIDTANYSGEPLPMDLRGIAHIPLSGARYIAGGMEQNQQVSKKTIRLDYALWPGIKEINPNSFTLFPNPTVDLVNIIFKNQKNRIILLTDVLGNEILRIENKEPSLQLNVSNYPKGIYIIKVESEEGSSSQKIVVQ